MRQQAQHTKHGSKRHSISAILCVVFVVIALVGTGTIVFLTFYHPPVEISDSSAETGDVAAETTDGIGDASTSAVTLVKNPIDFASLQQENPDIYAWITIPNTNISYPICQSATDDTYYLSHDSDGNESTGGAVFSEMQTSKDFTKPVSVIYGHNSGLFAEIHYFENTDFFNNNEYFYIYTPYHVITYRVISAYQYDNRHILNSFDFLQPDVKRSYFDMVCNPQSMIKNVREGASLSDDDRIVQLSTCMSPYSSAQRYIVTGVLVSDQAADR